MSNDELMNRLLAVIKDADAAGLGPREILHAFQKCCMGLGEDAGVPVTVTYSN